MLFPRTVARYAAIQVVFQKLFFPRRNDLLIIQDFEKNFIRDNMYDVFDDHTPEKIDRAFFLKVVQGTLGRLLDLEDTLIHFLPEGWVLHKMEKSTWALLCCGAYEIETDMTPIPVVINEYVSLAHGFLLDKGSSFVNAVLQNFANTHKENQKKAQELEQEHVEALPSIESGQASCPPEDLIDVVVDVTSGDSACVEKEDALTTDPDLLKEEEGEKKAEEIQEMASRDLDTQNELVSDSLSDRHLLEEKKEELSQDLADKE